MTTASTVANRASFRNMPIGMSAQLPGPMAISASLAASPPPSVQASLSAGTASTTASSITCPALSR